jgi:hypothetical protein
MIFVLIIPTISVRNIFASDYYLAVFDLRSSQRWLWRVQSSRTWHRVVRRQPEFSEEHIASIFRAEEWAKQESRRSWKILISSFALPSTLDNIVACRPVARRRLYSGLQTTKEWCFLRDPPRNNRTTTEERCFLCGSCWGYIRRSIRDYESLETAVRRVGVSCETVTCGWGRE